MSPPFTKEPDMSEKTIPDSVNDSCADVSSQQDESQTSLRKPGKMDVLVQGVALFSDGYNIQIIGYMNSVLAKL